MRLILYVEEKDLNTSQKLIVAYSIHSTKRATTGQTKTSAQTKCTTLLHKLVLQNEDKQYKNVFRHSGPLLKF